MSTFARVDYEAYLQGKNPWPSKPSNTDTTLATLATLARPLYSGEKVTPLESDSEEPAANANVIYLDEYRQKRAR